MQICARFRLNYVPCPVCQPGPVPPIVWAGGESIPCESCGRIKVKRDALSRLASLNLRERAILRGVLRERHGTVQAEAATLTAETISALLASGPGSVPDQLDRFLLNLGRISEWPGEELNLDSRQHTSLAYAARPEEFNFLLQNLISSNLVEALPSGRIRVGAGGWGRIQHLRDSSPAGDTAFIAMWFEDSLDDAYKMGLKPAIEKAGWKPIRVKDLALAEPIDDRIMVELRRARFIVADATGSRPNVYWEAGYAYALGRPVIWTMQEGTSWAFDTQQFFHIVWKKPDDLIEPLTWRIRNLVGQGPLVPDP